MLKLTKKADYGLIAIKHLAVRARQGGGGGAASASAKEIAEGSGIPLPRLSKSLQKLVRAGLLASEQGTNGGYRLARPADTVSALEVIREIDGPITLTACFTEHGECSHSERCNVREPLRKVHEGILRLLASITMDEMARDDEPARLYELELPAGMAASGTAHEGTTGL